MVFQISPGVNIQEIDLTTLVPSVSTSIAGISGVFDWGPLNERVLISNTTELERRFWKPDSDNYEKWFTAWNFLNYSNQLWTVRVSDEDIALNSTTGTKTLTDSGSLTVNTANDDRVITGGSAFDDDVRVGQRIIVDGNEFTVNTFNATTITTNEDFSSNVSSGTGSAYGQLVKNDEDYEGGTFTDFGAWMAKYPGVLGDSLKVSLCPDSSAYSNNAGGVTFTFGASAIGNTVVATDSNITDQIDINETLLIYNGKVRTITAAASNQITLNKTLNAQTSPDTSTNTNVFIAWGYYDEFDSAPGTSTYASDRGGSADEMHVIVIDEDGEISGVPGTVLETYEAVSKASDTKDESGNNIYYKDKINNESAYIRWGTHHPDATTTNWGSAAAGLTFGADKTPRYDSLKSGLDGISTVTSSDYIRGLDLFKNDEEVDVNFLLMADADSTVIDHAIDNIATVRKDCLVLFGPEKSDVVNISDGSEVINVVEYRDTDAIGSTSYAVMDSNWKYQYDKFNDVFRWVPLNGDIAGLMARTDLLRDPWWSPAGFNRGQIKNVTKLAWNPDKAERDYLYKNGVNPVLVFPGQGAILYGDKTLLSKPSAFDRINVRRLFIVIEKAIASASKFSLFEFNDEQTRAQFRNMIEPYLRDIQGRRGITDFKVVADSTNNTPEVIDRNEFRGDIYIKPARSINFINLRFVAVRSGTEFEEIVGQI